mgnify:FL=1
MDIALQSQESGKSAADLAAIMGIEVQQAERIYADIDSKRSTTEYLHMAPVLMD